MIVMDATFIDHLKNLATVLYRFHTAKLTKPNKKNSFFKLSVSHLVLVVSEKGISTDVSTAVKMWPRPFSKVEVKSFVGLCTYYIWFVPGFSAIACPLHMLSKRK